MGKPKVGLKDFMESASLLTQADWQRALTSSQSKAAELFGRSEAEQTRLGYFYTLRQICQQPWTWLRTCERMVSVRDSLRESLKGIQSLALTGSGSSEYAAECVRLALQNELGICVESISGGALLMYGGKALPPGRARSEEHTSELQSPCNLVCRLLLEKIR